MQTCPKCGYKENILSFHKSGNTYYANSKTVGIKYKIEKENNVYWFYHVGAKQRKVKLPVVYNVFIIEDNECRAAGGHTTLEEAKEYCNKYENE